MRRLPLSLSLLAGGGLLFEIALTRVLSLLYFSTFTYLVLSLAVLGLALGSALAALVPGTRAERHWSTWAAAAAVAALLVSFTHQGGGIAEVRWLLLPLTALPYCLLGLTVAGIFSGHSAASPRLYRADLAGAGIGALLAVPVLDLVGGYGAMLAAAMALALAALILAPRSLPPLGASLLCGLALTLQISGLGLRLDSSDMVTPKPLKRTVQAGGEVVESRWDSFARTDLVRLPGPGNGREGDERYLLYLDGGAGSLVPSASHPQMWSSDIGALAFSVEPTESAFLLGTGGGLDIALARAAGVRRIVAAEINRGAVELTKDLRTYAGDLYGPDVELHLDDGRSALRRQDARFDLILLSQVVSQAAELRGMALVENGLYTVEAFGEYLDRLRPDGRLALKLYDELTLTRALTTALTALAERGVPEAAARNHLFAALDTRADPPVPLLIVSKEERSMEESISWARAAENRGLALLLVPGLVAPPALSGGSWTGVVGRIVDAAGDANVKPTRDDRPFFYQFERGLPRAMRPLLGFVVASLLIAVVAASWWMQRDGREAQLGPAYFAAVGAGFMLVEISVLQKTSLLIGHPALALATVLASILLGAALGSGLAQRAVEGREYLWASRAAAAGVVLMLAWLLIWPQLAGAMRPLSPLQAGVGASFTLLPIAVALGAPFPLALRSIGRHGPRHVALAWALNGLASVAGAVAATALGIVVGFSAALLSAALAYALTALIARQIGRGAVKLVARPYPDRSRLESERHSS